MSADHRRRINLNAALAGALCGFLAAGPLFGSIALPIYAVLSSQPDVFALAGAAVASLLCLMPGAQLAIVATCSALAGRCPNRLAPLVGATIGLHVGTRLIPSSSAMMDAPLTMALWSLVTLGLGAVGAVLGRVAERAMSRHRGGNRGARIGTLARRGTRVVLLLAFTGGIAIFFLLPGAMLMSLGCLTYPTDDGLCNVLMQSWKVADFLAGLTPDEDTPSRDRTERRPDPGPMGGRPRPSIQPWPATVPTYRGGSSYPGYP